MSWEREGNTVTLRMDIDDWERLVYCLGLAGGLAEDLRTRGNRIGLMNRLAEGSPDFIPYELSNPADRETSPEKLRNPAGWPQRDAMDIQRAHDQFAAVITGNVNIAKLAGPPTKR